MVDTFAEVGHDCRVSSSRKHLLKLAASPSTVFATVVFMFGWKPVSPFSSWPLELLIVLCLPAMIPFVLLVVDLAAQQGGRRFRGGLTTPRLPTPKFRWRNVLTTPRATFVGALGVLVFVSFFSAFNSYRGSPEIVDGKLVFTDHGRVIGPATERQADEARTQDSRMFSGHLMLFGMVGLLARVPPSTAPPRAMPPGSIAPR
ncbi:MAG: hypothetical protein ACKV2O_24805 [Acidimicrobiales bacterium]